MKSYQWILFDADETLFRFDAFCGLQRTFAAFDVHFTEAHYDAYQTTNQSLWVAYQQGLISATQLQHNRFTLWAERLNTKPEHLNQAFLQHMVDICSPLDGAVALLNTLKGRVKLGIITNGFTCLQQTRLERTGLHRHFEFLVISEEVGVAKPHVGIFEHALSIMGHPVREQVLMVGDNLETDILGGLNAGFDTCWLNSDKKMPSQTITPHFEVASLVELERQLLKFIS